MIAKLKLRCGAQFTSKLEGAPPTARAPAFARPLCIIARPLSSCARPCLIDRLRARASPRTHAHRPPAAQHPPTTAAHSLVLGARVRRIRRHGHRHELVERHGHRVCRAPARERHQARHRRQRAGAPRPPGLQ
eukprot:6313097-Prymnesium_polylepis.1